MFLSWRKEPSMVATRKCRDERKEAVQSFLKLAERTQWVQIPTGKRGATAPEPSLAG
jgi:hypothetical protein